MSKNCKWTALVVTCKTKQYADAIYQQLYLRQKRGMLPSDLVILCLEDPQDGIGSGGATLNAVLTLTEHLCAKNGFTVVSSDVLRNSRLLIMHAGRYFPYNPTGRAFLCLPLAPENGESEDLITNFDVLYHVMTNQLAVDSPPGLWVCSCDMLLSLPNEIKLNWDEMNIDNGVLGFAVPASSIGYAKQHGVYSVDDNFAVKDIVFQGSEESILSCKLTDCSIPLVSGIVYFSMFATDRLLTTHFTPPLDACTYLGIDSGMEPIGLSLFFDILLALATNVTENDFVQGSRSGRFGKTDSPLSDAQKRFMKHARAVLWKHMRNLQFKVKVIDKGIHHYLDIAQSPKEFVETLRQHTLIVPGYKLVSQVHSYVPIHAIISKTATIINCIIGNGVTIGENSLLMHCHVTNNVKIGSNCCVYGLDKQSSECLPEGNVPSDSFVIGMPVSFQKDQVKRLFACVPTGIGLLDLYQPADGSPKGTWLGNEDWSYLITAAVMHANALPFSYKNVMTEQGFQNHMKTFFMAKIFPVSHLHHEVNISHSLQVLNMKHCLKETNYNNWFEYLRASFCEMLENVNCCSEFKYRRSLYFEVACKRLEVVLSTNLNTSVLPILKMFVICKEHGMIFRTLDDIAVNAVDCEKEYRRPDISARAFATIADVLGYMAGSEGGLRSGPAANKEWKIALSLLEQWNLKQGVMQLAQIREKWIDNPERLTRASRHYEGAEQILIRHAVMTASSSVRSTPCNELENDFWYIAECPARIDIAGGWTDTPPICYEYGGSVVNAAILLKGKRPIGARIRKISSPVIKLTLLDDNESETQRIECTEIQHFLDYNTPQAPGALLKACLIFSKVVDISSSLPLKDQLMTRYGGGFEMQTWSRVPRGSGLGTSSILAGAIIDVSFRACGRTLDVDSVIHAVLVVEQMLTTGGGWQDQIGGLVGGVKVGRSNPKLPLHVTAECIEMSAEFFDKFSQRLKLIYTGKTRLARNLLQNVLRNWYTKRPDIMKNCYNLKQNAEACVLAIKNEDLAKVGHHMNLYWQQKKLMASGCEPDLCRRMMDALLPYSLGLSLAGAGGGGFLYVLMKENISNEFISSLLQKVEGAQDAVVYEVEVDRAGMSCHTQSTN